MVEGAEAETSQCLWGYARPKRNTAEKLLHRRGQMRGVRHRNKITVYMPAISRKGSAQNNHFHPHNHRTRRASRRALRFLGLRRLKCLQIRRRQWPRVRRPKLGVMGRFGCHGAGCEKESPGDADKIKGQSAQKDLPSGIWIYRRNSDIEPSISKKILWSAGSRSFSAGNTIAALSELRAICRFEHVRAKATLVVLRDVRSTDIN